MDWLRRPLREHAGRVVCPTNAANSCEQHSASQLSRCPPMTAPFLLSVRGSTLGSLSPENGNEQHHLRWRGAERSRGLSGSATTPLRPRLRMVVEQRGQHQCAGAKCPIAKSSSGRDARPSRALLPTCWNFRSSNLGTISACEAERGVRSSLGTGDVSNAENSIHAAKRSGVEFPHPPPSAGRCRLRWCASASGGLR